MVRQPRVRGIALIYHAVPGEWVPGPAGFPDDATLASVYDALTEVHADAWIKHRAGTLPAWWCLVDSIRAEGFSSGPDRITWPEIDAALRWSGLGLGEATYNTQAWRQRTHGPDAGKPVRVTEHRVTGVVRLGAGTDQVRHPDAYDSPDAYHTFITTHTRTRT